VQRIALRAPVWVAVEGISGSGKTTVSRRLAGRLNARWIGEAYRRFPRPPKLDFQGEGSLLRIERRLMGEDFRRYGEAKAFRRDGNSVILDTDFLGPITYVRGLHDLGLVSRAALARLAREYAALLRQGRWSAADYYVYLDVERKVALQQARQASRTHPPLLRARHLAVGRVERQLFLTRLSRLLRGRLAVVSGKGHPDTVVDRILRRLPAPLTPLRAPQTFALRLVRAVAAAGDRRNPTSPGNR
jgi:thymidylate kinase